MSSRLTGITPTLQIPFVVSDGDHPLKGLKLTAKSSDVKVLKDDGIKILGQDSSAARVLELSAKGVLKAGVIKVTVTVEDPLGDKASLVLTVDVKAVNKVHKDGWALILKIAGSGGSNSKNANKCEEFYYDWKGWTDTKECVNHSRREPCPATSVALCALCDHCGSGSDCLSQHCWCAT